MKNLILTLAMNTAITLPMLAQQTTTWMGAAKETLGQQASASWMLDMETDGMEIHVSPERALVLVDREPIINTENGEAFLKAGIFGLAGTRLMLQGDIDFIDDSLLHGRYTGTLDGQPVVMDQFVKVRNDVPIGLVRVVRSMQGSAPIQPYTNLAYVSGLLDDPNIIEVTRHSRRTERTNDVHGWPSADRSSAITFSFRSHASVTWVAQAEAPSARARSSMAVSRSNKP
ncbi:MAG: hypothetical protein IPK99_11620 [Flavobacteriales bacterium]|nr:hypothetical protein [Flavobacteriales bacterium]